MNGKPCIAVVGGVNIDIQARCRSPFRPSDSNPGYLALAPGGVGRNIAENLVRLGSRVELISVLGDDEFSARLEDSCAAIGIGLGGCLRLADTPASQYLCILDSDGGLVGAVAAMDSIDRLGPERLEERASFLDSADLIMVDANIAEDSIAWIARRYPKGHGGPLLGFDPVSAKKAARGAASLGAFSYAKPNRAEAAVLAGLGGSEGEASSPVARRLWLPRHGLLAYGLLAYGPGGPASRPRLGRGLHLPRRRGALGRRPRPDAGVPRALASPRPSRAARIGEPQCLGRGRRRLRGYSMGPSGRPRPGRALRPRRRGGDAGRSRGISRQSRDERGSPPGDRERNRT